MKRLAPEVAALGGVMLAIVENERQLQPEQVARFRTVTGFTGPILADHGGIVTRRYQSLECPRLWTIDRRGLVRYRNPDLRTPPAAMAWDSGGAQGGRVTDGSVLSRILNSPFLNVTTLCGCGRANRKRPATLTCPGAGGKIRGVGTNGMAWPQASVFRP